MSDGDVPYLREKAIQVSVLRKYVKKRKKWIVSNSVLFSRAGYKNLAAVGKYGFFDFILYKRMLRTKGMKRA